MNARAGERACTTATSPSMVADPDTGPSPAQVHTQRGPHGSRPSPPRCAQRTVPKPMHRSRRLARVGPVVVSASGPQLTARKAGIFRTKETPARCFRTSPRPPPVRDGPPGDREQPRATASSVGASAIRRQATVKTSATASWASASHPHRATRRRRHGGIRLGRDGGTVPRAQPRWKRASAVPSEFPQGGRQSDLNARAASKTDANGGFTLIN